MQPARTLTVVVGLVLSLSLPAARRSAAAQVHLSEVQIKLLRILKDPNASMERRGTTMVLCGAGLEAWLGSERVEIRGRPSSPASTLGRFAQALGGKQTTFNATNKSWSGLGGQAAARPDPARANPPSPVVGPTSTDLIKLLASQPDWGIQKGPMGFGVRPEPWKVELRGTHLIVSVEADGRIATRERPKPGQMGFLPPGSDGGKKGSVGFLPGSPSGTGKRGKLGFPLPHEQGGASTVPTEDDLMPQFPPGWTTYAYGRPIPEPIELGFDEDYDAGYEGKLNLRQPRPTFRLKTAVQGFTRTLGRAWLSVKQSRLLGGRQNVGRATSRQVTVPQARLSVPNRRR